MELHQLRYFLAAADTGAISRAATRCGVSQPAVSAQLGRLEEELGVQLFDRLGRGVVLTEAGRALLPRARRICGQVEEVESSLRADLASGRGRVAIGAIPTMAPYLVPPLVAGLRAEFPECEVIVREDLTENLVEALVANELDVAIMSAPVEHDLIELEIVGREPLLVVTPADHPLAEAARAGSSSSGGGAVALADLRDLPAVTLHEMHCLGRTINEFCAARRLATNVVCRMTQIDTLLEFVRLGLGVSIVPQMVAQRDGGSAGRCYLRFKSNPPTRAIALAWRRGRSRSALARRTGEALRERISRLADGQAARRHREMRSAPPGSPASGHGSAADQ